MGTFTELEFQDRTAAQYLFFSFSSVREHPYLPIWHSYCELYLLTGNLASLIFVLGNKILPTVFTYRAPQQPGGTYIISLLNNEYTLNHDSEMLSYSILNWKKKFNVKPAFHSRINRIKIGFLSTLLKLIQLSKN